LWLVSGRGQVWGGEETATVFGGGDETSKGFERLSGIAVRSENGVVVSPEDPQRSACKARSLTLRLGILIVTPGALT